MQLIVVECGSVWLETTPRSKHRLVAVVGLIARVCLIRIVGIGSRLYNPQFDVTSLHRYKYSTCVTK
jgi:hypothetical protein